jgi:hypothetical protein
LVSSSVRSTASAGAAAAFEQLAVDVELRWSHAPLPTRTGRLSSPAPRWRQLALGQVVLAADAEHDLQSPPRGLRHADVAM